MEINYNITCDIKGLWFQSPDQSFPRAGNFDWGINLQQLVQSV